MVGFTAGLAIGSLLGVTFTFLLILLAAALSNKRPSLADELSPRGLAYPATALLAISGVSYFLKLDKAAVMLLLFLAVLAIAKLDGLAKGIGASAFAAGVLDLMFLPPIGSLKVAHPEDQFALALFFLSAIFASRLIGKPKVLPQRQSWSSRASTPARKPDP
jgi:K+-sensing histidine kinase KdpD